MARVLPKDPELETEAEAHHTWHIKEWRKLKKKEHGPVFECGGAPWCVHLTKRFFGAVPYLLDFELICTSGEFSFSLTVTRSTMHHFISSKLGKKNHQRIGMPVFSSL